MKKIEQKLLECFKQRSNFNREIDKISFDPSTRSIFYYNYSCLVYSEQTKEDRTKEASFCLPSFGGYLSNTTKSRVNTFLSEYGLQIKQKNYEYFCNGKKIKLDKMYTIVLNDGKYDFIERVL